MKLIRIVAVLAVVVLMGASIFAFSAMSAGESPAHPIGVEIDVDHPKTKRPKAPSYKAPKAPAYRAPSTRRR